MTPPSQLENGRTTTGTTVVDDQRTADNRVMVPNHGDAPQPEPPAGVDNVAFSRPIDDTAAADKSASAVNGCGVGGRQVASAPDRHQLPPTALTPVQFEMSYGTPADDGMSSKENLLTPRG